jgi:hypothetical protein
MRRTTCVLVSVKRSCKDGEREQGDGVKTNQTDRDDILGGSIFLLLLAIALFLSAFL